MMIDTQPITTSRGTYRCPYCTKSWKRRDHEFIEAHIRRYHLEEAVEAEHRKKELSLSNKNTLLENENRDLREKLKVAMTPAPAPEPEKKYYQCVLYCRNENRVLKAGMPKGVLVENVTCSGCGVKGALTITTNDPNWTF